MKVQFNKIHMSHSFSFFSTYSSAWPCRFAAGSTIALEPTTPRPYKAPSVLTFQNVAIQWYFWLGPQFQVETLAKSAKHANNVFLGITKKKGGMMDPGRCRVMFDHRGQIIAKPPQSAGYSTDIAEEDAIEIGMLTKKNHFAFAGPITNAKNAVSSSYATSFIENSN